MSIAQLAYFREQFTLLGPNKSGFVSLQNFKTVSIFFLFLARFLLLFYCAIILKLYWKSGCDKELHWCHKGFTGPGICQHGNTPKNHGFFFFLIFFIILMCSYLTKFTVLKIKIKGMVAECILMYFAGGFSSI